VHILLIGDTGEIGSAVRAALEARDHQVTGRSRSSDPALDLTSHDSIERVLTAAAPFDAVAVAAGSTPFGPLAELGREQFTQALTNKALGQIDISQTAVPLLPAGGSITLISGILTDVPVRTGATASVANGALNAYVRAAAGLLPGGIRINVIAPSVLTESLPHYGPSFPGIESVAVSRVAHAYIRAIEGAESGQIIPVR